MVSPATCERQGRPAGGGAKSVLVTWDEKELQLTPAIKLPVVDAPDITLWAYPNYAFAVPNVWRQEHR